MAHICNRVWATFDTAWPHGTIRQLQMSHRSTKYRVTSGRLSTCYKPRQARLMTFMEHLVCRKQLCVLCLIQMCLLCGKTCCYFLSFCGALWFVLTKKVVLSPQLVVECQWTHLGSLCQEVLKQYWFYHQVFNQYCFDEVMMWSVWLLWHIRIPFVDKKGEVNTVIA